MCYLSEMLQTDPYIDQFALGRNVISGRARIRNFLFSMGVGFVMDYLLTMTVNPHGTSITHQAWKLIHCAIIIPLACDTGILVLVH